ncbi:hypothetical protein [Micavibrio aeruginosavorus]|uniref:Uncharacterized protein n=1 Tax=Micavibrio aeruginosavorus (strain ARL-13) TaxID=856793 RepID=G2KMI0_MICAA|nr:hypothetical protein [Micavibrio aeruginosavorus]AEP10673.1 hypothetical protein MICA_2371 [Micavibrio aeruginosavorus ARL-13]
MAGVLKKAGSVLGSILLGASVYSFTDVIHDVAGPKLDRFLLPDHFFNEQKKETPQGREALGLLALGTKFSVDALQKLTPEDVCHVAKANALMNGDALNDEGRHADTFNDCSNSKIDFYRNGALISMGASMGRDGVARLNDADLCHLTSIAETFGETTGIAKNAGAVPAASDTLSLLQSKFKNCADGRTLSDDVLNQHVQNTIVSQLYNRAP